MRTMISFDNGQVLINGVVETDPLMIGYVMLDMAENLNEVEDISDLNTSNDFLEHESIQK